ncbi:MAG TPA: glycosyltransferase family 39 protein, partial [Cyanophyceae cyanobacterium]
MNRSAPLFKLSFRFPLILLGIIAIAVLLRIINLGSREFWYDEVLSLLLSSGQKAAYKTPKDLPVVLAHYTPLLNVPPDKGIAGVVKTVVGLLKALVGVEPHPPLFYLSQHFWLRLFGNGEAAVRSLGALLSVAAIGSAYGLGRRLLGHQGGLLFAALLGINDYYLFHSLNVRMYGPLVLWTILSAWSLLELIDTNRLELHRSESSSYKSKVLWTLLLIGSVAAGLMTFYLFVYWLIVLTAVVLVLDRQHWWHHALRVGAGILLTMPWALWGTPQQLRNADLERFATSTGIVDTIVRHVQDLLQPLGIHLILGDWVTSLPKSSATIAGGVAIALIVACSISLWRQNQQQLLIVVLLLGIFPLLLGFAADVLGGKFTIAFGWGRSMILILPGCLLLLVAWIERAAGKWQQPVALVLLLFYLSLSTADFSTRHRWMFHQIADIIEQDSTKPTLIAMNSQAWGHVLRLAYYVPPTSSVQLLAQQPTKL